MTQTTTIRRILQISPADGWFAVCRDESGLEYVIRLACWALVEEHGQATVQYLVGMDADPDGGLVDENEAFVRYVHRDDLEDLNDGDD